MRLLVAVLLLGCLACPAWAQLRITAVGDVRITPQLLARGRDDIGRLHLSGDVVLANFEGVLADHQDGNRWKFCMPYEAVDVLRAMGIDALNLANNHAGDLGTAAYRATLERLSRGGFAVAEGQGRGVSLARRGRAVRVVGYSFCTPNDVNDLRSVDAVVGGGREVVVVSAHMGGEGRDAHLVARGTEYFGGQARGDVVRFSRRCIEAGADLVLGHGPHVPRALELYRHKLIVYSLGNFAFDYPSAAARGRAAGYAISVDVDAAGDFRSARIDSYALRGGVPVRDEDEAAYHMIRGLTRDKRLSFPGHGRVELRRGQ